MTDWSDLRQAVRDRGLTIHLRHSAIHRRTTLDYEFRRLQLWTVREGAGAVAFYDYDQGAVVVDLIESARRLVDPSPREVLAAARPAEGS